MGQAVYVAAAYIFSSTYVSAVIIRTILVNVILGSLEFERDGVRYRARDLDSRG